MKPGTPALKLNLRAPQPVLLLIAISSLLHNIFAAQNPPLYVANPHSATMAASLDSGSTHFFNTYNDRNSSKLSAVTNADSGCGRPIALSYRAQTEQLGRSYAQHLENTSKFITDPTIAEYVNRLAQNLLANSAAPIPLTIKILDAREVSAFSLPGGFVFVNSGLILAADSEAELAGVISHEMAHLAACHGAQEMAREQLTDVASTPLIFRIVFGRAIRNTVSLKPTRSFESEADFFGLEYLYKAGYDPQALSSFLERIKAEENPKPSRNANALDVHPQIVERIERAEQEIKLFPPAPEYKLDTSEFQDIKKRLAGLQHPDKAH